MRLKRRRKKAGSSAGSNECGNRPDFNEVNRVGGKAARSVRSIDETHYAAFWYEFSDLGWNRVARASSGRVKQDLWERARTFAPLLDHRE